MQSKPLTRGSAELFPVFKVPYGDLDKLSWFERLRYVNWITLVTKVAIVISAVTVAITYSLRT